MKKIVLRGLDVCVVGGGMAGLCAALAAARHGAKTVLVQDRPVLGGNASSEIRVHITGADCHGSKPGWRETGLIEEIRLENLRRNPQESYWMWDMVLWEFAKREENLQLLLNTSVFEVQADSDRITSAKALQLGSECIYTIESRMYIDCSGDGTLGAEAGAEFRMGREAQDEFGESLAPEKADGGTMGCSTPFTAEYHQNAAVEFKPFPWAYAFPDESQLEHRMGHQACKRGFWWIEVGGQNGRHIIHDTPAITEELWKITAGVWDHIKNYGDHAGAHWQLQEVARVPGKRESRRFVGDYILSQKDLEPEVTHHDEVAYGGWPSDLHNINGFWDHAPAAKFHHIDGVYGIPLRSLYSRNIANLFFAGRNISATHVAMGSSRVMATCAVMGQAAGTAAAMCTRFDYSPRDLAREHAGALQQILLRDDVFLPHIKADDPTDVAPAGRISASSEREGCPAVSITDGISRDIPKGEKHAWESDPARPLPAHIEVAWQTKQHLKEVRLTWDSDLNKELSMRWYPPESGKILTQTPVTLVRDYMVEIWDDGEWREICCVRDNHQRHLVHEIEAATAALRITIERTWGAPSARMFELRCLR